jgi:OmpA-OmpF porin, OOP family
MASIFESIQELVTPTILSRLTSQTGESESAVVKGLGAAIPGLLSSISDRSGDHGFMKQVADLATSTAADPDPLRRSAAQTPTSSITGIDTSTAIGGFLSSLFGSNLSTMTDAIARYAGIRGSSAGSLLAMCAPLVLGYLGRLMRSDNLSAAGLGERLAGKRAQFAAALPAGFEMPRFTPAPVKTVHTVPEDTVHAAVSAEPERAASDWSFPLMLLLAALGIGGLMWWVANHREEQTRVNDAMSQAVGTTGVVSEMVTRYLPGNVSVRIPSGGAEDRLSMYLGSISRGTTSIAFDRIGFDTGSKALTPESQVQIANIAAILNAYPKASVTVAGHTDSTGSEDTNQMLSRARAEVVANALTAAGVPGDRVRAQGYGSSRPVADNSTDEGRALNRRVALDVAVQ